MAGDLYEKISRDPGLAKAALEMLAHNAQRDRDELQAQNGKLEAEIEAARQALLQGFVPREERALADDVPLARLVAHAIAHHQWHHDAASADYVRGVEEERDRLKALVEQLRRRPEDSK